MENEQGNGGVGIAWAGWIVGAVVTRFVGEYWLIPYTLGLVLAVVGCVLWAQRKNRHWLFGFWGLLAPIGFLGVALLKGKKPAVEDQYTLARIAERESHTVEKAK